MADSAQYTDWCILVDGKPVPADTAKVLDWLKIDSNRVIDLYEVDGVSVSTVFCGLDQTFGIGDLPPEWFETLVRGGPLSWEIVRYETIEQARDGHRAMVDRVQEGAV